MVSIAQLRNADRHWTGYRRPGRKYCCFSVPVPKSLRKAMHSVCAKIFWYFTILRPEIWIMTRILGGSRIAETPPIPMICWWLMMVPEIVILLWHDTKPNQIGWITSPLRTLVLSRILIGRSLWDSSKRLLSLPFPATLGQLASSKSSVIEESLCPLTR